MCVCVSISVEVCLYDAPSLRNQEGGRQTGGRRHGAGGACFNSDEEARVGRWWTLERASVLHIWRRMTLFGVVGGRGLLTL